MSALTPKQKRFCEEYIVDFNATQAAIRAGYSENTARNIAGNLLTKINIQEYVKSLSNKQQQRTEITADRVIEEIAKVAFCDIKNLYNEDGRLKEPQELEDHVSATVSSFKNRREYQGKDEDGNAEYATIDEYKTYDKLKALELLGKRFAIFTDKQEVTHTISEEMQQALLKASK